METKFERLIQAKIEKRLDPNVISWKLFEESYQQTEKNCTITISKFENTDSLTIIVYDEGDINDDNTAEIILNLYDITDIKKFGNEVWTPLEFKKQRINDLENPFIHFKIFQLPLPAPYNNNEKMECFDDYINQIFGYKIN